MNEYDVARRDGRMKHLVIDLRRNGGGNSALLQPLIRGLAARRVGPDRTGVPAFAPRVLIGRQTFSSAMINAYELRGQAGAVLVGSPTGGKPNSYGEVKKLELPHSKYVLNYSTKLFQPFPKEDAPSLLPEVRVPVTSAGLFQGRDATFEAAVHSGYP